MFDLLFTFLVSCYLGVVGLAIFVLPFYIWLVSEEGTDMKQRIYTLEQERGRMAHQLTIQQVCMDNYKADLQQHDTLLEAYKQMLKELWEEVIDLAEKDLDNPSKTPPMKSSCCVHCPATPLNRAQTIKAGGYFISDNEECPVDEGDQEEEQSNDEEACFHYWSVQLAQVCSKNIQSNKQSAISCILLSSLSNLPNHSVKGFIRYSTTAFLLLLWLPVARLKCVL